MQRLGSAGLVPIVHHRISTHSWMAALTSSGFPSSFFTASQITPGTGITW